MAAFFGLLVSYLSCSRSIGSGTRPLGCGYSLLAVQPVSRSGFPLKWHRWVWRTAAWSRQHVTSATFPTDRRSVVGDCGTGRKTRLSRNDRNRYAVPRCGRWTMKSSNYDFRNAVPHPRHRRWAWAAGAGSVVAVAALVVVPAAGTNALARWLLPWRPTERYTFVQLNQLPDSDGGTVRGTVPGRRRFGGGE